MSPEEQELFQIFLAESDDLLRAAEESLLRLEEDHASLPHIDQILRTFHTLKSGAAMVGLSEVSEYSHILESILERVRKGQLTVTKGLITFLLEAVDFIRSIVDAVSKGGPPLEPEAFARKKDQARRYLGIEENQQDLAGPLRRDSFQAPSITYYRISLVFRKDIFLTGQDPLLMLQSLSELGEFLQVRADTSKIPDYESFSIHDLYISWEITLKTTRSHEELDDVFLFVKDDNEIHMEDITHRFKEGIDLELSTKRLGDILVDQGQITKDILADALTKQRRLGEILVEEGKVKPESIVESVTRQEDSRAVYRKTSVRVEVDKINPLVNLAEEIGIGLSRVWCLLEKNTHLSQLGITEAIKDLLTVNRDFQERVARIRMFSLEGTFQRFQRMVRDLAAQQKKQIKVHLSGLDTELDKEVIEHITDPLKHLVRNSVDHGIETQEERRAKGKSPVGTIEFKAFQREGRIFIQVRDDGKGMDLEAIRNKAIEGGWIAHAAALDNKALLDLIFKPGFSTRSQVTELSGRGIGMDVARTEVEKIGGSIELQTERDKGTTFTLSLPLTFELMDALHVTVQGSSYLLPIRSVAGVERFEQDRLKSYGSQDGMYPFRDTYVPLVDLLKIFPISVRGPLPSTPPRSEERPSILVFLDTGRRLFALVVDEVLEPQQVVVKTLETNFYGINGIAGASILGDGSVSLVLDPLGIEEAFFKDFSEERSRKQP